MRVFVTGATGFVGAAVVQELLWGGHQVLGLARSENSAAALTAIGAEVHVGNLTDLDGLRSGAAAADAVIHTAFIHDFSNYKQSCEVDRVAIEAMGEILAGSGKSFIVTSGTGLLSSGQLATENIEPAYGPSVPRVSEQAAFAFASSGVNVSVVRLPPSVHGDGDHGFVPMLIDLARRKGVSAYIGDGQNQWPAVHRFDAARVYRLVLESDLPGGRYHAVAEGGVPFREIAEVIGRNLNVPVVSVSTDEAAAHFEWFAHFAGIDNATSSEQTRALLGWEPTGPGLIADIDRMAYYKM